MYDMMRSICWINRITPLRGFRLPDNSFRRALPYAIDFRAFSPMNGERNIPSGAGQSPAESFSSMDREKESFIELLKGITALSLIHKAESLIINSVGQRPTERNTHVIPKLQRSAINLMS